MKSYDVKEWDKLVVSESKGRTIKRATLASTVLSRKKLNKLTLKELIAKGIFHFIQTITKMK